MKPLSADLRSRILEACEEGQSYNQAAERFRVSRSSVKRFVKKWRETGGLEPEPASNGSRPMLGESEVAILKDLIGKHPDISQDELREHIAAETGIPVSQPTVCRTLQRCGFTLKKKTKHASEREREDIKAARQIFEDEMRELRAEDIIAVDETGCVTGMSRSRGYALCGKRAVTSEPAARSERLNIIGALSPDGFLGGLEVEGTVNGDVFEMFVRQVLTPHLHTGKIVIMDNISFHHREDIREPVEAEGASVKFLPAYSPEFNPIEECWSKVKAWLKKKAARTTSDLQAAITEAIGQITGTDAEGWFRHAGYQVQQ